jgi:hypothetical protein
MLLHVVSVTHALYKETYCYAMMAASVVCALHIEILLHCDDVVAIDAHISYHGSDDSDE